MTSRSSPIARYLLLAAVIALIVAIVWIDIATGLWQDIVILSGIAAGLLTFFLTAVFIQRWMNRSEHHRWLPVTRLALIDILHALADEDHSEISRGHIVARTITIPDAARSFDVSTVLDDIAQERRDITDVVARWSGFLSGSADVQPLMGHIAELGLLLERLRDDALDYDLAADADRRDALERLGRRTAQYNRRLQTVMTEIRTVLEKPDS